MLNFLLLSFLFIFLNFLFIKQFLNILILILINNLLIINGLIVFLSHLFKPRHKFIIEYINSEDYLHNRIRDGGVLAHYNFVMVDLKVN